MQKSALITGITGQDGSYLAEFLLEKDYRVHGLVRRTSRPDFSRIEHILDNIKLHEGDLTDQGSLLRALISSYPNEVYNLASQSFVSHSWQTPEYTSDVTGLGVLRMLEAIKTVGKPDNFKFYQASSSEMFGKVKETPQNEDTPFHPRSPYGVAKVFGHNVTVNYRESFDMFAVSGILFNHESPRRGMEFVTKKITNTLTKIKLGLAKELVLGNLDAKRDWGFAGDYIKAMWLMLQQDEPDDYVIATGKNHSVRDFVNAACKILDIGISWSGKRDNDEGVDNATGNTIVRVSKEFYRPAEVDVLLGNASKAREELGWKPETSFEELVKMMVEADLEELKR